MSLSRAQARATREELAVNLALSGLDRDSLGAALEFSSKRLDRTLQLHRRAEPSDV
jgi:hypothetical protein